MLIIELNEFDPNYLKEVSKELDLNNIRKIFNLKHSNIINLSRVESLVIDEADRMLSMGFIPDVKSIIRRTPNKDRRQTQLFSATLSEDIQRLAKAWTLNPFQVHILL